MFFSKLEMRKLEVFAHRMRIQLISVKFFEKKKSQATSIRLSVTDGKFPDFFLEIWVLIIQDIGKVLTSLISFDL